MSGTYCAVSAVMFLLFRFDGPVADTVASPRLARFVYIGVYKSYYIEIARGTNPHKLGQIAVIGLQNQYSWVQIPFGAPTK